MTHNDAIGLAVAAVLIALWLTYGGIGGGPPPGTLFGRFDPGPPPPRRERRRRSRG